MVPVRGREMKDSRQDLLKQFILLIGLRDEGWEATEKDVSYHSCCPDINLVG